MAKQPPKKPPKAGKPASAKKLTGYDRLWQEWKKRHPGGTRTQFDRSEVASKARKSFQKGKAVRAYGYVFTKPGSRKAVGERAAARRQAGDASGLTPKRYSPSGEYNETGVRRMDPALARQYERQIRTFFERRGSPLAKYARNFVIAGDISGFDPRFLAAISVWETGAGTAIAYPNSRPYNFWNWNNTDSGQVGADAPWQNVDTAFRYYAEQFGRKYTGSNLYRDFGVAPGSPNYATDSTWEAKIGATLRELGGNPYDVRWAPPLRA